jgi:amidase
MELNHCTAADFARLDAGRRKSVALVEACLARIEARDKDVQAWEHVDRNHALAQARARDHEALRSALHGVPVAVKDVIDTRDLPTEYGSPIYAGHRPKADAACVALLRQAGAVILGKTVTVELAAFHWARTRNPHNLGHTPGGSSSGSGAAVGDFMAPLALGTQTGGSTIRPAAYCGIVGYKPTFNLVNRAGMKPLAESQDTLGLMARSVPDVAHMLSVLAGCAVPDFDRKDLSPPRVGVCEMKGWPTKLHPAMERAMEDARGRMARAGARVRELPLPQPFESLFVAQRKMNDYEAWHALSDERTQHPDKLSSSLSARMKEAALCSYAQYREAQAVVSRFRAAFEAIFADHDVLLTPTVPDEPPPGLENTGDSTFIRIWTALHTPTLSLPVFKGEKGLPMGLQVIGPIGGDERTLAYSEWLHRTLTA